MTKKLLKSLLVVTPLLLAPLAQANAQAPPGLGAKTDRLVVAIKSVATNEGLLNDLTAGKPGLGAMLGIRVNLNNNPNLALTLNSGIENHGWQSDKIFRTTGTFGLIYFIGNNPNPDNSYYLGVEGGISMWRIDSNKYSYLDNNKNLPITILKFGKGFKKTFFEFGIESNSLDDLNRDEVKKYKESNWAVSGTFGFRFS